MLVGAAQIMMSDRYPYYRCWIPVSLKTLKFSHIKIQDNDLIKATPPCGRWPIHGQEYDT
jgi:hypothetical protein